MSNRRAIIEASLVVVLGVAAFGSTLALVQRSNDYAFFDPIISVKSAVSATYAEEISAETVRKMQEGAITGMLEALDDPYTVYVPPADTAEFNKDLTGEYVGIGAQVNITEGYLTIVSPLEDSPAYRAGLMAEDKVVEIEGQSTLGLSIDECVRRLMGQPGTPVSILVERGGQRLPVTIVRERINTRAVKGIVRDPANPNEWRFLIDPERKIAYLRITQFLPRSSAEVAKALASVGADRGGLNGLILDVRSNPGGVLQDAVAIADFFLKDGVIVSTRGRAFPERIERASEPGTLPDFPIVVLINGQSASASEILAGALVENDRAVAVGTRTFGKGSVQTVRNIRVSEGGVEKTAELKITEQAYYLPSGRNLTRKGASLQWGVDPSPGHFVPLTDAQTLDMLRARRDEDVLRAPGQGANPGAEPMGLDLVKKLKDPQLEAAYAAVLARVTTGQWPPVDAGATPAMTQAAAEELSRLFATRDRLTRDMIRIERRAEELERALGDAATKPKDLWPDEVDVVGGKVQVFDKDGRLISTLEITGNSLERWLIDAEVKPYQDASPK
ncbi:MAG: S41 family peptidase [Phycisphaeraceae bacterium]|nr:MAG: S41 family peptidase [Phycisphaeraceae bacterium]